MQALGGALPRQREHRFPVHVRVGHPGDPGGRARAQCAEADGGYEQFTEQSQDRKNAILKDAFTKVQALASTMTVTPKPAPKRKSAAK